MPVCYDISVNEKDRKKHNVGRDVLIPPHFLKRQIGGVRHPADFTITIRFLPLLQAMKNASTVATQKLWRRDKPRTTLAFSTHPGINTERIQPCCCFCPLLILKRKPVNAMKCNEAIEYIHSLMRFGIKPGLERITELCRLLGNPQEGLRIIHVAGTNGKGSTSTMAANMLKAAGYTVGLYTSPYVVDFRERIQVNGHMISPLDLAHTVEKVKGAVEILNARGEEPTEFEVITAVAFLYFKEKRCDAVVLEVGLGGRFDATNIIPCPAVSVIASVSLDHVGVLGDTVEKIAFEKAGIIKKGGVTVCYPEQQEGVFKVIEDACRERENTLILPDSAQIIIIKQDAFGTVASYKGTEFTLPLTGIHMVKNAVTAMEAVAAAARVGLTVTSAQMVQGIGASAMPARLEVLHKRPLTILDGGHNEGCASALKAYVESFLKGKRIVAVCSMMADKDYDAYLRTVAPLFDVLIASKTNVPRTLSAADLQKAAAPYCQTTYAVEDPAHALSFAHSLVGEEDVLLVCGSFYFAGEVRDMLQ